MVGYTTDQLRDLTIDEYSANTQANATERMRQSLRGAAAGDPQQFRWGIKRADGELIWVRMHLSAYTESERRRVLAEVSDVTDRYIASRRVGLFSRPLRHNLRNDVSVVAGRAEIIEETTDSSAVRESAAKIRTKAMEIGRLTESVKEIETATTRTVAARSHRHATVAVMEVVGKYRSKYPDADIAVEERDSMWLAVDDAFDHALGHALENAVVHNPDPDSSVTVTVGASPNTGRRLATAPRFARALPTAPRLPTVAVPPRAAHFVRVPRYCSRVVPPRSHLVDPHSVRFHPTPHSSLRSPYSAPAR